MCEEYWWWWWWWSEISCSPSRGEVVDQDPLASCPSQARSRRRACPQPMLAGHPLISKSAFMTQAFLAGEGEASSPGLGVGWRGLLRGGAKAWGIQWTRPPWPCQELLNEGQLTLLTPTPPPAIKSCLEPGPLFARAEGGSKTLHNLTENPYS